MGLAAPIAGVVSGGLSLLGQRGANKAQERANRDAIAEERRREMAGEARRKEALDIYRNNWQAWFQRHGRKGIDRYGMPSGIDVTRLRAPESSDAVGVAGPGLGLGPGPGAGGPRIARMMQAAAARRGESSQQMDQTLGGMLQAAGQGVGAYFKERNRPSGLEGMEVSRVPRPAPAGLAVTGLKRRSWGG